MKVRHSDGDSLRAFADHLSSLPAETRKEILLLVHRDGLMGIMDPDHGDVSVALRGMGIDPIEALKASFIAIEGFFETNWELFIDHMVNGFDQFDLKSAGGFCQDELQQIAKYCADHGVVVEVEEGESEPTGVTHETMQKIPALGGSVERTDDGFVFRKDDKKLH